jgi:choline dehydrogenase
LGARRVSADASADEADYVIVGAGTAGCVLANRLSADPTCRVTVVEAGGEDRSPWIGMPAGVARLFTHARLVWPYETEPEPQLGGRRLYWPRGRVVGGTSSINGMTYVRGHPADYDHWASLAGAGWSFEALLPYFRRLESHPLGPSHWHGADGPVRIGAVSYRHPLSERFREAMINTGVPDNPDTNGATQEGVGFNQVMMVDGRRVSAATAYLAPVRNRANLRVVTHALVRRIVVDDGRATGVELRHGGATRVLRARREVLVCAGTVASPQLLQLSGIGPAGLLRSLGIAVVADRAEVGRNLHEHVRTQVVVRTRVPSFNQESRGLALVRHVAAYALRRRGLLTATASQVNAFVRSSPDVARPDLQVVFRPMSGDYVGRRFASHPFPGVMAMVGLSRPRSRGHVMSRSADPAIAPRIVTGHLADPADADLLLRGLRLVRRVFATPPFRDAVDLEVQPGAGIEDGPALLAYIHANASSLFHAVGTCAMGIQGDAVVTPELRVRGVDRLRVVDASVMPAVPTGNTCAPVMMLAEKAADLIIGATGRPG